MLIRSKEPQAAPPKLLSSSNRSGRASFIKAAPAALAKPPQASTQPPSSPRPELPRPQSPPPGAPPPLQQRLMPAPPAAADFAAPPMDQQLLQPGDTPRAAPPVTAPAAPPATFSRRRRRALFQTSAPPPPQAPPPSGSPPAAVFPTSPPPAPSPVTSSAPSPAAPPPPDAPLPAAGHLGAVVGVIDSLSSSLQQSFTVPGESPAKLSTESIHMESALDSPGPDSRLFAEPLSGGGARFDPLPQGVFGAAGNASAAGGAPAQGVETQFLSLAFKCVPRPVLVFQSRGSSLLLQALVVLVD